MNISVTDEYVCFEEGGEPKGTTYIALKDICAIRFALNTMFVFIVGDSDPWEFDLSSNEGDSYSYLFEAWAAAKCNSST